MHPSVRLLYVLLLLSMVAACSRKADLPKTPMTFNGSSTNLHATVVVPTLDSPIPKGKGAIWCASFLGAWKVLSDQVAGGHISLSDAEGIAELLNRADDPRPEIPPSGFYAVAGKKEQGIADRIQNDLAQRFPSKEAPLFSEAATDSYIAYAYLEASLRFQTPYFENREPLEFSDSTGRKVAVKSFGIRDEDHDAYFKLRTQSRVLFEQRKAEEPWRDEDMSFAIDLCSGSSPNQIVVARIDRERSLAAMLKRVEEEVEQASLRQTKGPEGIGPTDVLLVPELFWQISHHFSELEGKALANPGLKHQRVDVAQQDILFRLDRSGAELKSESKLYASPIPTHYVLDRPFLIYMKKRGAKLPYFVMWVDNAELLNRWNDQSGDTKPGSSMPK